MNSSVKNIFILSLSLAQFSLSTVKKSQDASNYLLVFHLEEKVILIEGGGDTDTYVSFLYRLI